MIDDETLWSIRKLVEYLYHDEEKHFEECDKKGPHIFRDVIEVKKWLDSEFNIPKCPNCGGTEFVVSIIGEQILNNGRWGEIRTTGLDKSCSPYQCFNCEKEFAWHDLKHLRASTKKGTEVDKNGKNK